MEIFAKALQSSYAYILIFQILVVSSLFLLLLTLVIRRIREAAANGAAEFVVPEAVMPTVSAPDPAATAELSAKIAALEKEAETFAPLKNQNSALTEQVKFLESKLLEYEILQEEIGTLSTLKLENEQLKQKLVSLEAQAQKATPSKQEAKIEASVSAAPIIPEIPGSAPAAKPELKVPVEPTSMADGSTASATPMLEPEIAKEPTPITLVPPTAPLPSPEPPVIEPSRNDVGLQGLENLLQQIDELTKTTPEPRP